MSSEGMRGQKSEPARGLNMLGYSRRQMAQDKGLALPLQGLGDGGWKESRVGQSPRWPSAQLASPLPLTSETVPLGPLTLVFGDQGRDFLLGKCAQRVPEGDMPYVRVTRETKGQSNRRGQSCSCPCVT